MAIDDPNFRSLARKSVERAKIELAACDPNRLRYAALELREAMEALTYDRALTFKDEIPPDEYKTWQPKKLMAVLLEIDPKIDSAATISVGVEEEYGKPAPEENMKSLGTDHVFTLADIKTHYDAIGSYLHMPSLEQIQSGRLPDNSKLRTRCEKIVLLVEKVLDSSVWNVNFRVTATLDQCMNDECKRPIRKRMPIGQNVVEAQCFECKAEYTITKAEKGRVLWEPIMIDVHCSNPECRKKLALWRHEMRPGTRWRCGGCETHNKLGICVVKVEEGNPVSASPAKESSDGDTPISEA